MDDIPGVSFDLSSSFGFYGESTPEDESRAPVFFRDDEVTAEFVKPLLEPAALWWEKWKTGFVVR